MTALPLAWLSLLGAVQARDDFHAFSREAEDAARHTRWGSRPIPCTT